jgi:DnaJ-class molecular chaperone
MNDRHNNLDDIKKVIKEIIDFDKIKYVRDQQAKYRGQLLPENIQKAYQTFGLPQGASFTEIKNIYRELILLYHPDRRLTVSPEALEKTKDINLAYKELKKYWKMHPSEMSAN